MGKQELRYAAKVSLDKPAAEQACLHVSLILSIGQLKSMLI